MLFRHHHIVQCKLLFSLDKFDNFVVSTMSSENIMLDKRSKLNFMLFPPLA